MGFLALQSKHICRHATQAHEQGTDTLDQVNASDAAHLHIQRWHVLTVNKNSCK